MWTILAYIKKAILRKKEKDRWSSIRCDHTEMSCTVLHPSSGHITRKHIHANRNSIEGWSAKSLWLRIRRWRNVEKWSEQIRERRIFKDMGFSTDNIKGVLLALLSSLFIGASFIIKKKGLRRAAAASGIRAGEFLLFSYLFKLHFYYGLFVFSIGFVFHSWFVGVGGYSYLLEPLWWLGMITSKFLFFLICFYLW